MKERRYKKNYRIVTDMDPRTGRLRDRAVYTGDWFRFPAGSPAPRRRAARVGVGIGLYWLFALLYLRTGRATSRCMYALLPVLISLLPGAYALMGLFTLMGLPSRMTVTQRENGPGRLVRSALGSAVFSSAGAIGCALYLSLSARWAEGWHEPLLCAAASVAAWVAFAVSRKGYREIERQQD